MKLKKAALSAIGCVGMQIPYALGDDDGFASAVPVTIEIEYDGYSDHWWWDNVAHFLAGYAVGHVLARVFSSLSEKRLRFSLRCDEGANRERVLKAFLLIAGVWETFEYQTGERPWHADESGNYEWSFDHAAEDTTLDTLVGALGAYTAATEHYGYDLIDQ